MIRPILLILGPSGVGKSCLSEKLSKKEFVYIHIDTDKKSRTFAANGFPSEWDHDFHKIDLEHLVRVLGNRLGDKHAGAIISFPTVFVFTSDELVEAVQFGVIPVLLWGKKEHCIRAAKDRIEKKGLRFDLPRYERLNEPTFRAYSRPEYNAFRLEAFHEDGNRYPDEQYLVARVMQRLVGEE